MRYVIIVLILLTANLSYAKTYTFEKQCNPQQLFAEIIAGGIDLEDQIGYLNTYNDGKKIEIVIKDGVEIDEAKLNQIIENHKPKSKEEIKQERQKRIKELEGKLGITREELKELLQ